ncbi:MAG TPA: protein translocase subunit SecF [Natronosporangium sp.]|nr:protein translocase subunit SecF [Natronosporangium sp.]
MSSPVQETPRLSLPARLYLGQAGANIVDWRRRWLTIAAVVALISVVGVLVRGFTLGMEFTGGNAFHIPATVGTLEQAEEAVADAGASVASSQQVGDSSYLIRTHELTAEETQQVKAEVAETLGIPPQEISDDLVSAAWGAQITRQALIALTVFLALVLTYLVFRFELRAAVAAVTGLLADVVVTAGVYAIVGFEVTPATVIGFLTIMGFGLYDCVVVFDKIQENTRGITASNTQTYGEAANLAVNQVMMRSINTSVVALLPVGGLLFIGAGLLGAGTLKDLGLVLFVGMTVSFLSSLFLATPLLAELKLREPRLAAHTQRVLAKRVALAQREARKGGKEEEPSRERVPPVLNPELIELAGAAPKVGARPAGSRRPGQSRRGARKRSGGRRR